MNKIIKYNDLVKSDGVSIYEGSWGAAQNDGVYAVFFDFLSKIHPAHILEIGTGGGGFTKFLTLALKELNIVCPVLSYDVVERPTYKVLREVADVRIENVFDDNYVATTDFIHNYIKQSGVTLILCDGGNKKKEFNVLASVLKSGDYIMAHDYAETRDIFNSTILRKYWNWHEISDKDIADVCAKHNLNSYNKEIFDKVAWVCRIKV